MRSEAVDERDSTWERHDPRFRLYLFEGPGNAVTTLDLVEASIEEALEAGSVESDDDALLWSLALVTDDTRGARGLVWLSGMDYNDPPATAREWRLRAQMQNRFLSARSRRGLAPVLPDGRRVIRLFPEWDGGWPLWESFSERYRLTGPDLGLSPSLSQELHEWNTAWSAGRLDGPVPAGWRDQGLRLWAELQAQLSGVAEVRPEFLD